MTGSLQTKAGKYYMVIHYIDSEGKRKNKWISTKLNIKGNKKEAEAMLARWLHEHKECNLDKASLLFADYMEEWMSVAQLRLKPTTIRGYNDCLKNHILPYFREQQTKLLDLNVCHLEQFYAFLASDAKKLSGQSVLHCHRIISKALNDAVRKGIIQRNPAPLAERPKVERFIGSFLNTSQLKQLFTLLEGNPIRNVVAFIATYGLCRSEALGLCWDKVDFENNQFTICRSFVQVMKGNTLQDSTKETSRSRTFPLTTEMREMLYALKKEQDEYKALFQDQYANENNLVFVWPDGKAILPNYVTKQFHEVVKESTLPKVRLHDLRHSSASNLLAMGFSIVEVQQWLGHARASTTLDFYSHVASSSKQSICDRLEKEIPLEVPEGDSTPLEEF